METKPTNGGPANGGPANRGPAKGGPGRTFLIGLLILFGLALLVGTLTVLFP